MKFARILPCLLALVVLTTAVPASAFERVGDRKILVFAGRQEVPTITTSCDAIELVEEIDGGLQT
jgi:hypothetical protein